MADTPKAPRVLAAREEPLEATVNFRVFSREREEVEELADALGVRLSDAARIIFRRGLAASPNKQAA